MHITPTGDLRCDLIAELQHIREELVDHKSEVILAALVDRAKWDPDIQRLKDSLVREAGALIRQLLTDAETAGEVASDLDLDKAVTQLIAPMVFRRLVSDEPVTAKLIHGTVDDFLAAHGQPPANSTRARLSRRR